MARRKVSTLLDEHLFRRAKLESLRQRKQVSEISRPPIPTLSG
jgi:hypothetical protein